LFGKMKYELGDHSFVRCPELGLSADVEFKTKGYFGGTYNAIGGTIKNEKTGEVLYELSGMWTNEMWIKNVKVGSSNSSCNCLLIWWIDWEERVVVRCYESKAHASHLTTT